MGRSPYTQEDVEDEVLEVLDHGRTMTTQEITAAVKRRLNLSAADLIRANKRHNESKIDQIIANALQARRRLCRDGLIERVARGEFRITNDGKGYLAEHAARVAELGKMLADILPKIDED